MADHVGLPDPDSGTDPVSPTEFACPRCGIVTTQDFYGPCSTCRTTLRLTISTEARDVAATAYEPKMNVTPNAVAQKD